MASDKVKETSDQKFSTDVLKNTKPVLVDFWAVWCGPCKAIASLIDEIAEEHHHAIDVYKINIDDNPETPVQYGIRGIPTVLAFQNGQVVDQVVGAVPKSELQRLLEKVGVS